MKEELVAQITFAMEVEAIIYSAKQFEDAEQADKVFDTFMAGGAAALQIVTDVINRAENV